MNGAMNQGDHQDRRGARPRRAGVLAAALAGTALLATACSGGSSGGSPAAAGDTAYHKALAFAQCMRAHGEPGYPDPDSQGNFLINAKDHLNGALMQPAQEACQHLIPDSGVSTAQQRQLENQVLKFAACIRAHGLPDFPDPTVDSGGVTIQVGSGHTGHGGSLPPQFRPAMQACRKFLAGFSGGGT